MNEPLKRIEWRQSWGPLTRSTKREKGLSEELWVRVWTRRNLLLLLPIAVDKGTAKALVSPCQGPLPVWPTAVGQAYIISKKEAATPGTIVTRTLFLNSKSFCVLFDSGATHSFISTWHSMQLSLERRRTETHHRIKLSNCDWASHLL